MSKGQIVRINKGYDVVVLEAYEGGALVRPVGGTTTFTILDSEVV
jgi:hypothetical protein